MKENTLISQDQSTEIKINMNYRVRVAEKRDLNAIRKMVVELAIYEQEPDAVLIDDSYYEESFESGLFSAIIAENDEEIIGIAIYYMTFSTWKGKMLWLEDLVVKEEYRRIGIGQAIWNQLIKEAKRQGAKQMKWQVLDWNEVALNFYHKNDATIEKGWWNGKLFFD